MPITAKHPSWQLAGKPANTGNQLAYNSLRLSGYFPLWEPLFSTLREDFQQRAPTATPRPHRGADLTYALKCRPHVCTEMPTPWRNFVASTTPLPFPPLFTHLPPFLFGGNFVASTTPLPFSPLFTHLSPLFYLEETSLPPQGCSK